MEAHTFEDNEVEFTERKERSREGPEIDGEEEDEDPGEEEGGQEDHNGV